MSGYKGGVRMLRQYPGLWFVWSPGGRVIHRLIWRFPPYKRLIDRLVWRDIRKDPDFDRDIAESLADLAAGRAYYLVDGEFVPHETWKADDPEQPDDWVHDGTGWVKA